MLFYWIILVAPLAPFSSPLAQICNLCLTHLGKIVFAFAKQGI